MKKCLINVALLRLCFHFQRCKIKRVTVKLEKFSKLKSIIAVNFACLDLCFDSELIYIKSCMDFRSRYKVTWHMWKKTFMICLISSNNSSHHWIMYENFMDSNKSYTNDQWLSVGEVGHVYQNHLENLNYVVPCRQPHPITMTFGNLDFQIWQWGRWMEEARMCNSRTSQGAAKYWCM